MSTAALNEVKAAGIMVFRLLNSKIEYLLLQASYLGHHWTPPKGHVDPGESDITAAKREVEEEAGLRPEDYDIIDGFEYILKYQVNNKPKSVTYWTAKVKDPQISIRLSNEHENFQWCDLPTLFTMTEFEDMKESYRKCEDFLRKKFPEQLQ